MILSWQLTFFQKGQVDNPMQLFGENIEKTFFQELLNADESYLAQIQ